MNWSVVDSVAGHAINAVIAIAAFAAWWSTLRAYRGSYRPVLRPVPMRFPNGDLQTARLIVKNIGRGPALSVCLFDPKPPPLPHGLDAPVIHTIDLVEPLGPPLGETGEQSRIGRVVFEIDPMRVLRPNVRYRLLYQDLTARWHETEFWFDETNIMRARYLGPFRWWDRSRVLPDEVGTLAQVVTAAE